MIISSGYERTLLLRGSNVPRGRPAAARRKLSLINSQLDSRGFSVNSKRSQCEHSTARSVSESGSESGNGMVE